MTLLEIRNDIESRADDTSLSDATLTAWVNLAYKDVLGRFEGEWPFLLATATTPSVAGQASYALPTDFMKAYDVTVGTDEYVYVPFEDRNVPGLALAYTIDEPETQYTLYPTPDTAGVNLNLTYFREPVDMIADGDEPIFPSRWHEVIVYMGLMRYYQRWREPGMTAHFQELAEQIIQTMKEFYSRHQAATNPVTLRPTNAGEFRQKSILFR